MTALESVGKKRGRPSKKSAAARSGAADLSAASILKRALKLAKTVPLEEVSIVRLSKEFDVTPAAIHYYISTRGILISGVMNAFFRELLSTLPGPSGDWKMETRECWQALYTKLRKYKGVAHFMVSNNQLRLVQITSDTEEDYGLMVFDRVVSVFQKAGFGPENAALAWHLLAQTALSVSHSEAIGSVPRQTKASVLKRIGPERLSAFPGVEYAFEKLTDVDVDINRDAALEMMLNYLELLAKKKPHYPG